MEKELKKLQGAQKQAVYVERENAKCAAAVALPGGARQPDRAHPRRRPTGTPRTHRGTEGARGPGRALWPLAPPSREGAVAVGLRGAHGVPAWQYEDPNTYVAGTRSCARTTTSCRRCWRTRNACWRKRSSAPRHADLRLELQASRGGGLSVCSGGVRRHSWSTSCRGASRCSRRRRRSCSRRPGTRSWWNVPSTLPEHTALSAPPRGFKGPGHSPGRHAERRCSRLEASVVLSSPPQTRAKV